MAEPSNRWWFDGCADAPAPVRLFSRALFLRNPLAEELPEFTTAVAALRRNWHWLLLGYLGFVGLLVVPGLLRDRDLYYKAAALVLPHLMLYLLAMMVAYSWVGYRINLGNLSEYLPKFRKKSKLRLVLIMLVSGGLGAVVGYNVGGGGDTSFVELLLTASSQWVRESFPPVVLTVLFFVIVTAVPELIAQLRLREHRLARRLGEAEAVRERMARTTAESELRLLQAQVEPHFLYNTLANLRYLVQTGSGEALRMADALIEYLRTSVPDMRAQHVTLGREVDHAGHYLEIMQMRMGGRLRYQIEVADELRTVPLPPLVVLTLVENAVKHGVGPRVQGGTVRLRARRDGEFVELDVEDDGVGLVQQAPERTAEPSTGTGLDNVRGRLGLVYGERASLVLLPLAADGSGTRARLRFPAAMPAAAGDGPRVVVLGREEGERLLGQRDTHSTGTAT